MIHTYSLFDRHIVLDVASGAVHEVDADTLALLQTITPPMSPEPPVALPEGQREIWGELFELQQAGLLFTPDEPIPPVPDKTPLKALCLHVAHDCNLRCDYCFASTGDFGTGRKIMPPDIGERAVDFLLSRCGERKNLEIDFFGGEPLMSLETIRRTVDYARRAAPDKNFRFTTTTNGLLLDDETSDYLNAEMDNVVLSLDGRQSVNDAMRKTIGGRGSYDVIVPKFRRFLEKRDGDYFVRGTYTAQNLDFAADVLAMAEAGFTQLSVEPVVLEGGHRLALTEADLPVLYGEYEKLTAHMLGRDDFAFFHFNVDLEQGPCVYKRLRGCGAGYEYAAVSPEGDLYPCHQFVGREEYKLGSVLDKSFDGEISARFSRLTIDAKPACRECWARYYCSGGCAASNLTVEGDIAKPYELGCALERKRLECAIYLKVARQDEADD